MKEQQIKNPHPNPVGHAMIEGTLDTVISQYDLSKEIEQLHKKDAWLQRTGPSSKTLVKHTDLRIVLIAMRGKMCMPQHRTGARFSVQTLTGHLRLHLLDRTLDLRAGHLLVLDQCIPHDVESEEDSAFLLTLSWHSQDVGKCMINKPEND